MLTETMKRVLQIVPYLDVETQQKLLALVREYKGKLAVAEGQGLPQSAVDDLVKAVPDQLMADIVRDLRSGVPEPGMFKRGPGGPVHRGTGWVEPKAEDRTNQFRLHDAIVDHLVGGPNDTSKLK